MVDNIKQLWVDCRQYDGGKIQFLSDIYSLLTVGQSIVFVQTRREADAVAKALAEGGYTCSVLHGEVEAQDRDRVMQDFRDMKSNVLITTNVLARGVDVDTVGLVVNYDVPVDRNGQPDYETYLHRIGRTGRFGRKGTAISLVGDERSVRILAAIEKFYSSDKELIKQVDADPESLAEQIEI
jgi:ATP-dependent RNA helicase DDX19/DBP5